MFVGHVLLMILVATAAELLMGARSVSACATTNRVPESISSNVGCKHLDFAKCANSSVLASAVKKII